MKGKFVEVKYTMGKCTAMFEISDEILGLYDELKDKDLEITVKKFRKKRSLDCNAYAWVLIDKISEKMRLDKALVYRQAIKNIGGVSEMVCVKDEAVEKMRQTWESNGLGWQVDELPSKIPRCTNLCLYYGSSTYDSRQMSDLVDILVQDAKALGIETLPPDELLKMKGLLEE